MSTHWSLSVHTCTCGVCLLNGAWLLVFAGSGACPSPPLGAASLAAVGPSQWLPLLGSSQTQVLAWKVDTCPLADHLNCLPRHGLLGM